MKKLFVISIIALFTLGTMQVQAHAIKKEKKTEKIALKNLRRSSVSYQAEQQFISDFGILSGVKWVRGHNFYEATFIKDGKQMTAYYDMDDQLIGTSTIKTFADLPVKAQKVIKTKYEDYTIGPVTFYDDNKANNTEMVFYGIQLDDKDNYFVELTNGNNRIVLRVDPLGGVFYFTKL